MKSVTKRGANRSTTVARQAIAEFVNGSVPQFNRWLAQIANGIPCIDGEGKVRKDANGSTIWLVKPDPATAMKLVADVAEYHLPKLSRQEVSAVVSHENRDLSTMSTDDLKALVLREMGLDAIPAEFSMVEQSPEPLPAFLVENGQESPTDRLEPSRTTRTIAEPTEAP